MIKEIFKRGKYVCSFHTELKILSGCIIVHLLTIFVDLPVPIALLYGPALYRMFRSLAEMPVLSAVSYHWHQLPFYAMIILGQLDLDYYHMLYLPAMPLSLLGYSVYIVVNRRKIYSESRTADTQLFKLLVIISLAISVPLSMFACRPFMSFDWGFSVQELINYILALCVLIVVAYLFSQQRQSSLELSKQEQSIPHATDQLGYTLNPVRILRERQLYLDPLLSLEKFASEVGLPKHRCTRLIQMESGKSFYQLIAEYRIEHARHLLKQDVLNELTIESIAESCGFNSKASFNRYFKELSGCTPSEYRKKVVNGVAV